MENAAILTNVDLVLVAICVALSIVARLLGIKDARYNPTNVSSCPSGNMSDFTRNASAGDPASSSSR